MSTATLAIEYLPLAQLSPYARNSRTHSPEQVQALANSIRRFGFNNPVLIDGDGTIVAGHGRVQAAAVAGLESVPCIRLAHLTDDERRAYVIADNRLGELSGWDAAMLASEVEELLMDGDLGIELSDIGFDDDAFAGMSAHLPDLEPTPPRAPKATKPAASTQPEDGDRTPTADDYADVGQGAANPAEGKGIQYPLILQLNKPTLQQWRKFKGQRSDSRLARNAAVSPWQRASKSATMRLAGTPLMRVMRAPCSGVGAPPSRARLDRPPSPSSVTS